MGVRGINHQDNEMRALEIDSVNKKLTKAVWEQDRAAITLYVAELKIILAKLPVIESPLPQEKL